MSIEDYRYTIKKHVAITAGAGTGKTYTLSRRYVNALLGFDFFTFTKIPDTSALLSEVKKRSALPVEIVTTTFTEAGAMEMRSRIEWLVALILRILKNPNIVFDPKEENEKLEIKNQLLQLEPEFQDHIQVTLNEASSTLYLSIISTIHRFAISIINTNTELVPMDMSIDVIDETIKAEIFDSLWFDVATTNSKIFLSIDKDYSLYNARDFAQRYVYDRRIRDGFDAFVLNKNTKLLQEIYLKRFFQGNIEKIIDVFMAHESFNPEKLKPEFENVLKTYLESVFNLQGEKLPALAKKGSCAPYTAINKMFNDLLGFNVENEFTTIIHNIHSILKDLRKTYLERLHSEGKLDFDRILEVADNLLKNPKADISNYKYFFVDEFQDTNTFQWDIIKTAARLAKDNEANIFLVGDEKQSIFEFQGADVSTFRMAVEEIKRVGKSKVETPRMSENFRSDAGIIDFVNNVFDKVMLTPKHDIPPKPCFANKIVQKFIDKVYTKYLDEPDILNQKHEVEYKELIANSKKSGTVKVLLQTTKLSDETKKSGGKLESYNSECRAIKEAEMLAKFIIGIKDGSRPEYNDIKRRLDDNEKSVAILCDAKANMLIIKDALKRVGLEAKVSASEDFYKTKEIKQLFHILAMIDKLQNSHDLYISSPPEKEESPKAKEVRLLQNSINQKNRFYVTGGLRTYSLKYSDKEIVSILNSNKIPKRILALIELGTVLSLGDLLTYIIEHFEMRRVFAHKEDFAQVKANIKKLVNIAHRFKAQKFSPLTEFVTMLEGAILNGEAKDDQAFYESKQTNAIEIRTMHSSKGLAWPMVIVPELGRTLKGKTNTLHYASYQTPSDLLNIVGFNINGSPTLAAKLASSLADEKKYAEKKRLLYVAMTRPENHLVLSLATNEKESIETNSYFTRWLNLDLEANNVEIHETILENSETIPNCMVDEFKPIETLFPQQELEIKPLEENVIDLTIKNPFKASKAATFGTAAHLLIEIGYKAGIFDTEGESQYIEEFRKRKEVSEKARLYKVVENFKKSSIYEDLKLSKLVLFEEEFNFFDEQTQTTEQRYIDLIYYKDEKWNIIDFKSNVLLGRKKEEIIQEHEYTAQLKGYYDYVASRFNIENIELCSILWLDDGTLTDMTPKDEVK